MSQKTKAGIILPPAFKTETKPPAPTFKTTSVREFFRLSNKDREKFIPQIGKEFRVGAGSGAYLVYEVCAVNLGQFRFTCTLKEIQTVEK